MRKRGFEVTAAYQDKTNQLAKTGDKNAAGYDFEAAEDIVIPAI